MSFAVVDLTGPKLSMLASCNRVYQRYYKLFGVAPYDFNGVAVFNRIKYYYNAGKWIQYPVPRMDPVHNFINVLGGNYEEFREQEIDKEISNLWFELDPKQYEWDGSYAGDSRVKGASTFATTQLVAPSKAELVAYFNEAFNIGDEVTVITTYGGKQKRYVNSHKLEWTIDDDIGIVQTASFDTEAIRNTINSNPWYYFANTPLKPYTKDTNQFQLYDGADYDMPKNHPNRPSNRLLGTVQTTCREEMGLFASLDYGTVFEVIKPVFDEKQITSNTSRYDGEVLKYTYSTTYKFNGIDEDSGLIADMADWYEQKATQTIKNRPAYTPVGTYRERLNYHILDNNIKRTLDSLQVYIDPNSYATSYDVSNSLFYFGHLRYEEARLMRRVDFTQMVMQSMTSDNYDVEDASKREKFLTGLAFVVAIFIIWVTWGAGTPAAVSIALGNGAMVLTIAGYLLSVFGGLSTMGLVEVIGKVAQMLGIASAVLGFYAMIQNAGEVLAKQTLTEAGTSITAESVANEMLQQTLLDQVEALVSQSLEAITTKVTEFVAQDLATQFNMVTDGLEFVTEGMKFYQDQEYEKLKGEYDELLEEQKDYESQTLSNVLKNPASVWGIMEDRVTSYDAITNTDIGIQQKVGADESFLTWNSNVNSK